MASGRKEVARPRDRAVNVGLSERAASVAAGSILALLGLGRRDLLGLAIAGVGGAMLHRGATGYCHAYSMLGVDSAHEEASEADLAEDGLHIAQSLLIDKPADELYAFWRDLSNLPGVMPYLESVESTGGNRSRWVAKAPGFVGGKVEWDAEITSDEPGKLVAWRSLAGADVDNAGWVRFEKAPGERGTYVHVRLDYLPPAGVVGKWVATLFGTSPDGEVKEALRALKRLMETGEIATIVGQPRGSCLRGGGSRETSDPQHP